MVYVRKPERPAIIVCQERFGEIVGSAERQHHRSGADV